MTNPTYNPDTPQKLSDDDLKEVNGGWSERGEGWSAAGWDQSEEDRLQADYAAHGAGMSLEDFMVARGITGDELLCRTNWLQGKRLRRR